MAKALGTLIFRGMMGVISIAATAIITVLVQRYLYEKTGTPALILAPPTSSSPNAAPPEPGDQQPATQANPADSSDSDHSEVGISTDAESEGQGDDRPTKIMEQFWDKLNR